MSEQHGPFKVEQIYGFSLLRVTGPAEVARVFTKQDAANKYAADLNAAFLAGQRSADAGLREACERAEWRIRHVQGDCDGCPDLPNMDQCALCVLRAALAKAKEGT